MFRQSFGLRIFLLNFFLLILPVLVYLFLIAKYEYDNKIKSILFDLKDMGTAKATLFNDLIDSNFRALNYLTTHVYFDDKDPSLSDIQKSLIALQEAQSFAAVSYYEKEGDKTICKTSSDLDVIGEDFAFRNYVKDTLKSGKGIEIAYGGWPNQRPLIFISKGIKDADGQYSKLYIVVSYVKDLLSSIINLDDVSSSAKLSLLTGNNTIFFSSDINFFKSRQSSITEATPKDIENEELAGGILLDSANINFEPIKDFENAYRWKIDSKRYVGVKVPIKDLDYFLLADEDESMLINQFYVDFGKIFIFLSIIILVVALFNILVIRRLSMPFDKLVNTIKKIGAGDYKTVYTPEPLGFEINEVGLALNEMTSNFVENLQNVKDERLKREVLAKELKLGREIQKNILPQQMPDFALAEVYAYSLPALEVSGDFYDVYTKQEENADKKLIVTIGDTSGKGISGCLYSFGLKSMLKSYGMRYSDLRAILSLANTLFCLDTSKTSTFVTCFIMELDSQTKILQYGSAGHIPAILLRGDKSIEELTTDGTALGVSSEAIFETNSMALKKDDIVFTFTNGILNLKNPNGEIYGKERLKEFLSLNSELSIKEIIEKLIENILEFSKGAKINDDVTLLAFKVR
jgi:serine phosphatase RsbU (regulator of sigma subunit)